MYDFPLIWEVVFFYRKIVGVSLKKIENLADCPKKIGSEA